MHGGVVGRIEHLLHRVGERLLSQDRLRLLVWLLTLAALGVNAATLPALYGAVLPIALVVSVLHAASLIWALSRPWFAVGVSTIAVAATTLLTVAGRGSLPWPLPVTSLVITALLAFILAVRASWRRPVAAAVLPVAAATLAGLPWQVGDWGPFATNVITAISILALVVTFGILIHQWLLSRAELLEQQEITAAAEERSLLMEERTRIARELHDVVAHGLSVISIQASTLQYRIEGVSPEVVTEMDDITDSARRALAEMRGLLAVLRQEDADNELAPQPTLASIPALVESTRRSAETVRLDVTGDLDDPRVNEAASVSAYRIVQEALSNALRHAPGSEIDVAVAVTREHVLVQVENGRAAITPPPAREGGFGLRGMQERASFAHGEVLAQSTRGGGFLVRALLPVRQPPALGEKIPPT
ncbi:sensor histidine kinase [Pseudactinotalea sp.]|uniref:sensor histidine kinase n=1 Tax=Pseudactinotalea sp. TaxID=1926260 RepID=UPI003B3A3532